MQFLVASKLATSYCLALQEMQDMFQQQGSSMPSLEEMFTNMFGGGGNKQSATAAKKTKPVAKRPGTRR